LEYKVKRQHLGDRLYLENEIRTANHADVDHLVANGVLTPIETEKKEKKRKSLAAPRNKALRVQENK